MKTQTLIAAIMALSMSVAGSSFAQGNGERNDDNGNRHAQGQREGRHDRRGEQGSQGQQQRPGWNEQARHNERGAGPDHRFYRGDRLPPQFRGRVYVVNDWHQHRLSPPPRGYHWVQTGGDYVLVAITTGIILELLLNR